MSTYSDHEQRLLDQQSGAELDRQAQRREAKSSKNDLGPYELEVGLSGDEREVIVNHPEMTPNPGGRGGHIVFSPRQARAFAALMIEKANACVGQSAAETTDVLGHIRSIATDTVMHDHEKIAQIAGLTQVGLKR